MGLSLSAFPARSRWRTWFRLHRADGTVVRLSEMWYSDLPWHYAVVWHRGGKVFAVDGCAYGDTGEILADLRGHEGTGRFLAWLPGDRPRALVAAPLR